MASQAPACCFIYIVPAYAWGDVFRLGQMVSMTPILIVRRLLKGIGTQQARGADYAVCRASFGQPGAILLSARFPKNRTIREDIAKKEDELC